MYNKIKNPSTNRWVNINTKLAKTIVKNYLLQIGGVSQVTESPTPMQQPIETQQPMPVQLPIQQPIETQQPMPVQQPMETQSPMETQPQEQVLQPIETESNNNSESDFFNNYIRNCDNSEWRFRIHTNPPTQLTNYDIFKINNRDPVTNTSKIEIVGFRDKQNQNPCECETVNCDINLETINSLPEVVTVILDKPTKMGIDSSNDKNVNWYGQAEIYFSQIQNPSIAYYYHEHSVKARGGICTKSYYKNQSMNESNELSSVIEKMPDNEEGKGKKSISSFMSSTVSKGAKGISSMLDSAKNTISKKDTEGVKEGPLNTETENATEVPVDTETENATEGPVDTETEDATEGPVDTENDPATEASSSMKASKAVNKVSSGMSSMFNSAKDKISKVDTKGMKAKASEAAAKMGTKVSSMVDNVKENASKLADKANESMEAVKENMNKNKKPNTISEKDRICNSLSSMKGIKLENVKC